MGHGINGRLQLLRQGEGAAKDMGWGMGWAGLGSGRMLESARGFALVGGLVFSFFREGRCVTNGIRLMTTKSGKEVFGSLLYSLVLLSAVMGVIGAGL